MTNLYSETTDETTAPLYTEENVAAPIDNTKGNYSILKGVAALASSATDIPDDINYNQFVDEHWRKTVPENTSIDRWTAINAATNGQVSVVEEALSTIKARNAIYGVQSSDNAAIVRAKMQELTETAVENTAIKNPSVLFNNTPAEIKRTTDSIVPQITAQSALEKAMKDGQKWSTIAMGIGYEFTPFAAEQGPAIDRVAIKYGVPADAISRTEGRSKTISYLQVAFNAVPDNEKGIWLDGLYKDLQNGALISDWQAAIVIQEVALQEDKEWGGFSDWADRLGVVGTVASGLGAVFKGGRLLKSANTLMNVERTLAAVGAKNGIVAAEGAKVLSKAAAMERMRAAGVIAGELTGLSTALDLGKLVSMNAAKVLPDAITTSAHDLQKLIRQPVERLIAELQDTVAAKGIRAEEAALQLEELNNIYAKANNPNIHSVNPFELSADGTSISGKVYYKPEDSSAYLTKEAAENLKSHGFILIAAEQVAGSQAPHDLSLLENKRYAIVFGNEVYGISDDILRICDNYLEIPQVGTKHSLNVAVSAGIVLWEFFKALKKGA